MTRYEPRLQQFLRALERREMYLSYKRLNDGDVGPCIRLSERMREAWESKRFWFNYGIRKSFDIDAVYWAALHEVGDEDIDDETRGEMERFADMKMEQLKQYDAECKLRFDS